MQLSIQGDPEKNGTGYFPQYVNVITGISVYEHRRRKRGGGGGGAEGAIAPQIFFGGDPFTIGLL